MNKILITGGAGFIGSNLSLSLLKTLKKYFIEDAKINITGSYCIGDIRHNFADLKKIKKALGYTPKVSFDQCIARFVDWVNTQEIMSDNFEASISEMKQKGLFEQNVLNEK